VWIHRWTHTDGHTNRGHGDVISVLLYFYLQIKERRIKRGSHDPIIRTMRLHLKRQPVNTVREIK
jgi:hypothetical protein